ncbi:MULTISPECIES: XisI protein [Pseudanabaena]|uniref:XisI protein n=1 Tax=Pseudanabaena TaxID=1152 RepID=UPI002478DC6B|nr:MULTISPECIES: XisI protein [Pseudanabaena]MEA5489944.1 XisI protein [Pseudanabaena sp. CCNP1317]WGS75019.1 XisI protein [Pseudanabaena galeata CCNP1313]
MDTVKSYQAVIKQVISEYAKLRPSHGNIHLEPIFDDVNSRYALMQFGWDRERRVRGNLIYVSIKDGKVLIEYDGIEGGITQDLIQRVIPEQDIVLAFLHKFETISVR